MLKAVIKRHTEKQKKIRAAKYNEIKNAVIKFYEDLDIANGSLVNVPSFIRAEKALKANIKTDKDIDRIYKNLRKHKKASIA